MSEKGFYGRRMVPEPLLRLLNKLQKAGINITEQDILDLTNGVLFNAVTAKESVSGKSFAELMLAKQNKLTAGTNITIDEDDVISATGGGGITQLYKHVVDCEFDGTTANNDTVFAKFYLIIINTSNTPINTLELLGAQEGRIVSFMYDDDTSGGVVTLNSDKYLLRGIQGIYPTNNEIDISIVDTSFVPTQVDVIEDSTQWNFSDTVYGIA